MHDSRRYRYNAAECLLAAQEAGIALDRLSVNTQLHLSTD
jgi:hypothetical protein